MIRIAIYHWLPIADNMLQEIEKRLRALPCNLAAEIQVERDAVTFHTVFKFNRDFRSPAVFPVPVKISQRGYCQHVLNLSPDPNLPLHVLLNELIPDLRRAQGDLLFAIAPEAVRNELAIVHDGIPPFQQFQSTPLDAPTDQAARHCLYDSQITAIILDETQQDAMRAGFSIPSVELDIPAQHSHSCAVMNPNGDCILFYSTNYHPDEWTTHDSVIFKYCALVLYLRMLDDALSILRQTRHHITPLRRRLSLALQGNITDDFDSLTQIKRYLTYVNIKLPVVQKVIHRLQGVRLSETFLAKVQTFDEPVKVFAYSGIRSLEDPIWQPHNIIGRIHEHSGRINGLLDEDVEEIRIISSELSQVLEGTLLTEQLQVAMHSSDAAQAMLDMERTTKKLANAYQTVIVMGMALISITVAARLEVPFAWLLAPAIGLGTLSYVAYQGRQRRAQTVFYRLSIPVRARLSSVALLRWVARHPLTRNKIKGNQVTCTWNESLRVRVYAPTRGEGGEAITGEETVDHMFEVAIDFERNGFVRALTIQTEHTTGLFDARDLVQALFQSLYRGGCMNELSNPESSLYATTLTDLEIQVEARLPALNKLLTLPSRHVAQILTTGTSNYPDNSISRQDLYVMQDLNTQPHAYKDWLLDILNNPAREDQLALFGKDNVRQKFMLVSNIEGEHGKHC